MMRMQSSLLRPAAPAASTLTPGVSCRSRVRLAVRADMKKQKKELEKTLKTFTKRLEKTLKSSDDAGLISSIPSTNALISELLAQLQSHPMLQEEESSSSSSSDSSEEDEPRMDKREMKQDRKMLDRQAQLQQLATDAGMGPQSAQIHPSPAAAATTSAGVLGMASPAQSSFSSLLLQQRLEDSLDMSPSNETPRVSSAYIAPGGPLPSRIMVCTGSKCMDRGADEVLDAVTSARNTSGSMAQVVSCKCLGKCKMGPAMRVKPSDGTRSILHTGVTPQSAVGLVSAYLHPADSDLPSSADVIELPVVWDHETLRAPFC